MAYKTASRVRMVSNTTGMGDITLRRVVQGFRSLDAAGLVVGDTVDLTIEDVSATGVPTGDWEMGTYTVGANGVLSRTVIKASSNGGNPVDWQNGTRWVSAVSGDGSPIGGGGGTLSVRPRTYAGVRGSTIPDSTAVRVIPAGTTHNSMQPEIWANSTRRIRLAFCTGISSGSSAFDLSGQTECRVLQPDGVTVLSQFIPWTFNGAPSVRVAAGGYRWYFTDELSGYFNAGDLALHKAYCSNGGLEFTLPVFNSGLSGQSNPTLFAGRAFDNIDGDKSGVSITAAPWNNGGTSLAPFCVIFADTDCRLPGNLPSVDMFGSSSMAWRSAATVGEGGSVSERIVRINGNPFLNWGVAGANHSEWLSSLARGTAGTPYNRFFAARGDIAIVLPMTGGAVDLSNNTGVTVDWLRTMRALGYRRVICGVPPNVTNAGNTSILTNRTNERTFIRERAIGLGLIDAYWDIASIVQGSDGLWLPAYLGDGTHISDPGVPLVVAAGTALGWPGDLAL